MLTDVTNRVFALQEPDYKLFMQSINGTVIADPNQILQGTDTLKTGWHLLDSNKPDGLNLDTVKYADIGLNKDVEVGELFATERTNGSTRFYFVWASRPISLAIKNGFTDPLNFHVLFHPPTWESCYARTPYWDGLCPDWHPNSDKEADVCVASMQKKPLYVRLGLRYASQYSLAIPQHLIALTARQPNLVYVAPVADYRDFSDLATGSAILSMLREVADFLSTKFTSGRQTTYPGTVGKIILSGYSHSGTRLSIIMNGLSPGDVFFSKHLSQINAFDVVLGGTQAHKEAVFNPFWNKIIQWKLGNASGAPVNKDARAFIYTAYRFHANFVLQNSKNMIGPPQMLNLDQPKWSNETLRNAGPYRRSRGQALEAYNSDASLGVLHLPGDFFFDYFGGTPNSHGYTPSLIGNGHSWFLRALMSHALVHADPSFFGPAR